MINNKNVFVEKDLLPHVGGKRDSRGRAITPNKPPVPNEIPHEVEGIYWIIKDVIGIHYQTEGADIKVCLRLFDKDEVCEVLSNRTLTCKLTADMQLAKASLDLMMNLETMCLTFSGIVCVRSIFEGMQWQCIPSVAGTIFCWYKK